jgi:FKBP-type peptidyl-prolyl cis-trans isomerase FkpA
MQRFLFICIVLIINSKLIASPKDTTNYYKLPDSIKAVKFTTVITLHNINPNKNFRLSVDGGGGIIFDQRNKKRRILFTGSERSTPLSSGTDVRNIGLGAFNFNYAWKENTPYKILISIASDSASQTFISSGYIFLPEENKWKFLGCRREAFSGNSIKGYGFYTRKKKYAVSTFSTNNTWVQRTNGLWKNLTEDSSAAPAINLLGHIDSAQQHQTDINLIESAIAAGKVDAKQNDGIYYSIIKEGNGKPVVITDTVSVFYKGYLFSNGEVFDETKDKPATFPLNRLIKGWQIGIPLCKVGGKIKLIIPSDLAYSIRTIATKIPPNSILVFEIEVVDAK